jgi:5-(carboxyamino)imidazole ribonucleotide mutase
MLELKPDPNPESSSGASQPEPNAEARPEPPSPGALIGIIMGSRSDWPTLEHAAKVLDELGVPYEAEVVSAHRTPDRMFDYAATAESRGIRVIIAGAGGAAHLPGMVAAKTRLPVLGVPVQTHSLHGVDSLLSIVQMPGGIPVATFAIGNAGAKNAGLFAASILALNDSHIAEALESFRRNQTDSVLSNRDPRA